MTEIFDGQMGKKTWDGFKFQSIEMVSNHLGMVSNHLGMVTNHLGMVPNHLLFRGFKPLEMVKTLECRWDVSGIPYQLVQDFVHQLQCMK